MERLNTSQSAKYLGLSEGFLRKLRGENAGPDYYKLGAKVMYTTQELDRWFESCKTTTADSIQHQ